MKPVCAKCGDVIEPWQVYSEANGKFYCGDCVHIEVLPGPPDVPCACSRFERVAGSREEQAMIPQMDNIARRYERP